MIDRKKLPETPSNVTETGTEIEARDGWARILFADHSFSWPRPWCRQRERIAAVFDYANDEVLGLSPAAVNGSNSPISSLLYRHGAAANGAVGFKGVETMSRSSGAVAKHWIMTSISCSNLCQPREKSGREGASL